MAPVGGLLAHTVYHGSPHKFDKFDMSKIGTGEGAQAYGHGLYFAESPGVAKSYADSLGIQKQDTVNNAIDRIIHLNGGDVSKTRDALMLEGLSPQELTPELVDTVSRIVQNTDAASGTVNSAALKHYEKLKTLIPEAGQMYKVDIPDEAIHRMLDWDAALSKQPESIKPILRNLLNDAYGDGAAFNASGIGETAKDYLMNQSGASAADIIKNLSRRYGDDVASKMLREAGIPGIRYLDGSSRGAGQGTSNFVLFDDQLARIIERNGQPTGLLPWKEGEWLNLNSK